MRVAHQSTGLVGLGAASTYYMPPTTGGSVQTGTGDTANRVTARVGGVMSNIYIRFSSNAATTAGTFISRNNAANGNQSVSIPSATTGEFEDTTNTDTIVSGTTFNLRLTTGATTGPTTNGYSSLFRANQNTVVFTLIGGNMTASTASTTFYWPIFGRGFNTAVTTESRGQSEVNIDGDFRNMCIDIDTNARTATTTYTLRKNGANTSLTVSVGSTATGVFEDTTHIVQVAAGDKMGTGVATGANTNNTVASFICYNFVNPRSYWIIGGGGQDGIGTTAGTTQYLNFSQGIGVNTTQSRSQFDLNIAATISKLWCNIYSNSTSLSSTFGTRKNAATDGTLTLSIASATTGEFENLTDSDSYVATDEVYLKLVAGGTGTHEISQFTLLMSTTENGKQTALNVGQAVGRAAVY